jgi:hypothetical protein
MVLTRSKRKVENDCIHTLLKKKKDDYTDYETFQELKKFVQEKDWESTDRELTITLTTNHPFLLEFMPENIRGDKTIVMNALKDSKMDDGDVLEFLSEELRADSEVVMAAIKTSGTALKFASEKLKADPEIVLQAVQSGPAAISFASNELKNDRDFVKRCIKVDGYCLYYLGENMRTDRELIMLALDNDNENALEGLGDEFVRDRKFIKQCVSINPQCLRDIPEDLLRNREFFKELCIIDGYCFYYAPIELRDTELLEISKQTDYSAGKVFWK